MTLPNGSSGEAASSRARAAASPMLLTPADIADRLRRGVRGKERVRGDHDFPGVARPKPPLKPAAVLVPIVLRAGEPTVLLTQRSEHLTDHPGQISFPGGRIEPEDSSPEHAALREAAEEVGLDAAAVELLGRLDVYHTGTGYEVTPVVGLVRPPFSLTLDPVEVAAAFEVPLRFILDTNNHYQRTREWKGALRQYWEMPYLGWNIWGATAGMLVNLSQALTWPLRPPSAR